MTTIEKICPFYIRLYRLLTGKDVTPKSKSPIIPPREETSDETSPIKRKKNHLQDNSMEDTLQLACDDISKICKDVLSKNGEKPVPTSRTTKAARKSLPPFASASKAHDSRYGNLKPVSREADLKEPSITKVC
jgi:hypothetical protein